MTRFTKLLRQRGANDSEVGMIRRLLRKHTTTSLYLVTKYPCQVVTAPRFIADLGRATADAIMTQYPRTPYSAKVKVRWQVDCGIITIWRDGVRIDSKGDRDTSGFIARCQAAYRYLPECNPNKS